MSIMLKIMLCTSILFTSFAKASCDKNPVFCQIKKNKPNIKNSEAIKLALLISKASDTFKVSSRLLTAILMQESGYDINAKNCSIKKTKRKLSVKDIITIKPVPAEYIHAFAKNQVIEVKEENCFDFGIGQINIRTINAYGFIFSKIISDLEYSIFAAALVLRDFKRSHAKYEEDWWTRYNASSPDKREIYKSYVIAYL